MGERFNDARMVISTVATAATKTTKPGCILVLPSPITCKLIMV